LNYLVVITTNGEREPATGFSARCVSLTLQDPTEDRLVVIAARHFPQGSETLHREIAKRLIEQRDRARALDLRPPSTSEYLDAIRACADFNIEPDPANPVWQQIAQATLVKGSFADEQELGAAW